MADEQHPNVSSDLIWEICRELFDLDFIARAENRKQARTTHTSLSEGQEEVHSSREIR